MWSVLGIGVAVIVRTSTLFFSFLIFSLSFTPKRCSSSIINKPKSLNSTSLLNTLCVPTTTSTSPSFSFFTTSSCSFFVLKRFKSSTFIANFSILFLNSSYCWFASTVVGTKYTTCFWSITALNAALIATSVFPYPTSPHNNLSIGLELSISFFISSIHLNWSSVSWYGNLSSNSFCHGVSLLKLYPWIFSRFAYSSINSLATSLKLFLTLAFVVSHSLLPNLLIFGFSLSPPTYFLIESKSVVGIYKISSFLYFIFM